MGLVELDNGANSCFPTPTEVGEPEGGEGGGKICGWDVLRRWLRGKEGKDEGICEVCEGGESEEQD